MYTELPKNQSKFSEFAEIEAVKPADIEGTIKEEAGQRMGHLKRDYLEACAKIKSAQELSEGQPIHIVATQSPKTDNEMK